MSSCHVFGMFSPFYCHLHVMQRPTVSFTECFFVCGLFCGSCRQQSQQSLAADISERGRQNGTKFCR